MSVSATGWSMFPVIECTFSSSTIFSSNGASNFDFPAVKPDNMNKLMRGYVQHKRLQFNERLASFHSVKNPVILQADLKEIEVVSMIGVILFLIKISAEMRKGLALYLIIPDRARVSTSYL